MERERHRALGGKGRVPDDGITWVYDVTVQTLRVSTEDKGGAQIPRSFIRFVESQWCRAAFAQAERKLLAGVHPALYLEVPGRGGWLVVRVGRDR